MIALSTPLTNVRFVSVDVETTGLDPRRDKIVEIAAVCVQNGQIVQEWDTLVSIDRTIPFEARRVHGISNEMLIGKPPIGVALAGLLHVATDGVLVEHSNRAFDVSFLEAAYGAEFEHPYVNTCTLSRKLFPFMRRHSLAECCKRHGIGNDNAHRALSDARATGRLLIALLEVCSARYPRLEDLVTVASVQR